MQEFTFGMLTYNQEEYVFEHLESIRYQIENYGKDVKTYFVLSDDASKDNTVKYVEDWISNHKELFAGVTIVSKEKNEGIVPNYLMMLSNIHTQHYKILAGDDLYYKSNVFEVVRKGDFLLTPMICFDKERILPDKKRYNFKQLILCQSKGCLKEYLIKRLKYSNCIDAPGTFINRKLIDNDLFQELRRYQWIEDVPMWNYLLDKDGIEIKLLQEPYILYRSEVGISNNKNHSVRNRFEADLKIIDRYIYTDKSKFPKMINPYKYKYLIEREMMKFNHNKNSAVIQKFNAYIFQEEKNAEKYLSEIINGAREWKSKYFSGDKID